VVRIDSGVREGDAISPFYDPMIAKLIVWGADRDAALAGMAQALAAYQVVGLASNISFLKRLIASHAFATADLDTGLIERNRAVLFPPLQATPMAVLALACMALVESEKDEAEVKSDAAGDPWSHAMGWRLNQVLIRQLGFFDEYSSNVSPVQAYETQLSYRHDGYRLRVYDAQAGLELVWRKGNDFSLKLGSVSVRGTVKRAGDVFHVFYVGQHYVLNYHDPMAHAGEIEAEGGRLTAPMPGKVVAVLVAKGAHVTKGAPLVIMEAMKMEHTIAAPHDGLVQDILYEVGDQVADNAPLLVFTAAANAAAAVVE
jgi:3-methylcrotonyl-CoA carboxylase alpha subunit